MIKFSKSRIFKIIKGFITLFLILFFLIFIILCEALRRTDSEPINYVMISYKEGSIIFYLSGDYEFTIPPRRHDGFKISPHVINMPDYSHSYYWGIDSDYCGEFICPMNKCKDEEFHRYFSKITYGKVPKCYHEVVPVYELTKGDIFEVSRSNIPSKYHKLPVYFSIIDCRKTGIEGCAKTVNSGIDNHGLKLAGCDDNAEQTCLFTNSPAPPDIENIYNTLKDIIIAPSKPWKLWGHYY